MEAPCKQKCHKLAFSERANWSHCPCISLPHKKKGRRPTWETHDWPATPPTSLSYCLGLVVGVRVFDCLYMEREFRRCQSASRHGTRRCCDTDALEVICNSEYQRRRPTTGITVASFAPAVALTLPRQHIRHGESCTAPHGHINCSTHIVPGCK